MFIYIKTMIQSKKEGVIIKEHITELQKKFEQIKRLGWIENSHPRYRNAGLLFEALIGKKGDSFSIPDYYEIEIKTHRQDGQFPITLFHFSPISHITKVPPCQYLVEQYGYKNHTSRPYKILYANITYQKKKSIASQFKFELGVNEIKKQLELHVYDNKNKLLETSTIIWPFEGIKEKLNNKVKIMAYIEYQRLYENKQEYFRYTNINFYYLTNFENFLQLIKQGKIKISLNIGVHKEGERMGEVYDHGAAFRIWSYNLPKLFKKK